MRRSAFLALGLALPIAGAALPASAATFALLDEALDASLSPLGTFETPAAGGPLTAAAIVYDGIVFDILGAGSEAPIYDAASNEVDGAGGFGLIANGTPFSFVDGAETYDCPVGTCVFALTDRGGGYPTGAGEWYVEHPAANYALGLYQIELAAIPLPGGFGPAAASLLLLAGGAAARRRSRAGL